MVVSSRKNIVRVVGLRQNEANPKLGFSLRGGKESTGSSVGVFVSHVEKCSEADRGGLKIGDRLIQVNGLNVNQATYDEVIGLIRATPKSNDILLQVEYCARIPVQEKSGDPIKWIEVSSSEIHSNEQMNGQTTNSIITSGRQQAHRTKSSLASSSDDGIGSCESQQANSLCSADSTELANSSESILKLRNCKRPTYGQGYDVDSSTDLTCSSSNSVSACSISISSAPSDSNSTDIEEEEELEEDDDIIIVRVPGGQLTSEPFGCGVVKGPDEWPGIFVQNVKEFSLAERVGLEPGDQLIRADGQLLAELSFEAAIRLIKRLQQQQDELKLHVKKGAALRHLAQQSRQQQRRKHHQLIQQQIVSKRKEEDETLSDTSLERGSSMSASKENEPTTTAATATTCNPVTSVRRNGVASSVQLQQANGETSNCFAARGEMGRSWNEEEKKKSDDANHGRLISGTQSHLSGKMEMRQVVTVERKVRDNGMARDVTREQREPIPWMEQADGGNKFQEKQKLPVVASPNDERQVKRLSELVSARGSTSSGGVGGGEERIEATMEQIKRSNKHNETIGQLSSSSQARCSSQSGVALEPESSFKSIESSLKSETSSNSGSRQQLVVSGAKESPLLISRRKQSDEDCNNHKSMPSNTSSCCNGDQQEEIVRIVSQNCRLHHYPVSSHLNLRSSLVHETFPHPAAKLEQQSMKQKKLQPRRFDTSLQNRTATSYTSPNQLVSTGSKIKTTVAPPSRRRLTVEDMRRHLGSKQNGMMQRYMSMDNLSLCTMVDPTIQAINLRSLSANRQYNGRGEQLYSNPISSYPLKQPFATVEDCKLQYDNARIKTKQRLYKRSSSVLGQHSQCSGCNLHQTREAIKSKTLRQSQICLNQSDLDDCCKPLSRKLYGPSKRYSNTINAPLSALTRSKAMSMDKLNISYTNLLNPDQRIPIRQMQTIASKDHSRQHKSLYQQRRLLEESCYMVPKLVPLTCLPPQTPIYNYATASGMISETSQSRFRTDRALIHPLATANCCHLDDERACYLNESSQQIRGNCRTSTRPQCSFNPSIKAQQVAIYSDLVSIAKPKRFLDCNSSPVTCCNSIRCCPQLQSKKLELAHGNKYSIVLRSDGNGATTDSSGYLSANEHNQGIGAHKKPNYPPKPPPPPSIISCNSSSKSYHHHHIDSIASQVLVETRQQRVSTFLTNTGNTNANSSSCILLANGSSQQQMGNNRIHQSPDCSPSSSSYSPNSSPRSSLDVPTSDSSIATISLETITCRQQPSNNNQKRKASIGQTMQLTTDGTVPRPPPLPAKDADFELKIGKMIGKEKERSDLDGNSERKLSLEGETSSSSVSSNRKQSLCFVDELKMLANRQQQQPELMTDSSTLIKIINASKVKSNNSSSPDNGKKRGCNCNLADSNNNNNHDPNDRCRIKSCVTTKSACLLPNSKARSNRNQEATGRSGNKLDEVDNRRRQHEMLMKEFKSAHLRMFSRRHNNGLDKEKQDDSIDTQDQGQISNSIELDTTDNLDLEVTSKPRRITSETAINAKRINHLVPQSSSQPILQHMAAAN